MSPNVPFVSIAGSLALLVVSVIPVNAEPSREGRAPVNLLEEIPDAILASVTAELENLLASSLVKGIPICSPPPVIATTLRPVRGAYEKVIVVPASV